MSFKEPTVQLRTACGGQDCHGEEGFPTAKGKESTEELAIAGIRQEREWTAQRPPGRHVRGAISRNLREAGVARAQDRRQSKDQEARIRQVPHKGSSCLVGEPQLLSGLEEPKSVLGSTGVRKHNKPDRGRD